MADATRRGDAGLSATGLGLCKLFTAAAMFVVAFLSTPSTSATSRIYGVDLELLKIRPALPPSSFQYELQVDYSKAGNMIDFGVVSVRTVASNHELIFPEFANRNPFSLRAESQGVVCFRLYQTNRILLEDCWQIRDLLQTSPATNSFYNSETFTKTKADGTMLTYKITQYLINVNNEDAGAAFDDSSRSELKLAHGGDKTASLAGGVACPLCSCSCTAPLVFAVLEGGALFALTIIILYYKYCKRADANGKAASRRPNLNAANNKNNNNVGDSAKNEKTFCWSTNQANNGNAIFVGNSDVKKPDDETKRLNNGGVFYSTTASSGQSTGNEYASSGGSTSEYYSDNNDNNDGKWSAFLSAAISKVWPKAVGRQIRTALRNVKRKSNSEPPEPPPPDYRNETFDVDDPLDRVYDSIDEKHLGDVPDRK